MKYANTDFVTDSYRNRVVINKKVWLQNKHQSNKQPNKQTKTQTVTLEGRARNRSFKSFGHAALEVPITYPSGDVCQKWIYVCRAQEGECDTEVV